jgi:hypothetical protein
MEPIKISACFSYDDTARCIHSVEFHIEFSGITVEVELETSDEDPPGGWVSFLGPDYLEYGRSFAAIFSDGDHVSFKVAAQNDQYGSGSVTVDVPVETCRATFEDLDQRIAIQRATWQQNP